MLVRWVGVAVDGEGSGVEIAKEAKLFFRTVKQNGLLLHQR